MGYMNKKIIKRGFNYPTELLDKWEKFHFPSKDYSPSASGAMFVYMLLPAHIREKARKLAYRDNLDTASKEFLEYFNLSTEADTLGVEAVRAALVHAEKIKQEQDGTS